MTAKVIAAGTDKKGRTWRLVADKSLRIVEELEEDALGAPRWISIGCLDVTVSLGSQNCSNTMVMAFLVMFDDMSETRKKFAESTTYKPSDYKPHAGE